MFPFMQLKHSLTPLAGRGRFCQRPSRYAPGADGPYARRSSIRWSASRRTFGSRTSRHFCRRHICLSPRVGWPRFSRDGTPEGSQLAFAVRGCCPWTDSPSIRSTTERHWLVPSSLLRCLISVLCSPPSLAGRQRGFFIHRFDRSGGGVMPIGRWCTIRDGGIWSPHT